ncbi:MAG: DUF2784 domain-containing protein [Azonexus sp.]|nr:DUF2784 domain-containing protein [Azonexus sp.]
MSPRLLADTVLLVHLAFILLVIFGGLLTLWRRGFVWLHLPALAWGVWIEFSGHICPLTPLENHWRRLAGEAGYPGGFVEHYLLPLIYPAGLTGNGQLLLGLGLITFNVLVYVGVCRRHRRPCR